MVEEVSVDLQELHDLLKEPIREFLLRSAEDISESQIPTRSVWKRNEDEYKKVRIKQPSKALESISHLELFLEPAETLYDEFPSSAKKTYDSDTELRELPIQIRYLTLEFRVLAGAVADQEGHIRYSDESFEQAIEWFYDSEAFRVVVPLLNFMTENSINLEADWQSVRGETPDEVTDHIKSVRVTELTESEKNGICTSESVGDGNISGDNVYLTGTGFNHSLSSLSHKIEITYRHPQKMASIIQMETDEIDHPSLLDDNVAASATKCVLSALRLFQPSTDIGVGPRYHIVDHWMSTRENVEEVVASGIFHDQPYLKGEKYRIGKNDVNSLTDLWGSISPHMEPFYETDCSRAMRRLNSSYQKTLPSDELIDLIIGLEGTLLRGMRSQSSYTFRSALRGSLLLEDRLDLNRDSIKSYFKNLFEVRGEILHNGKDLEEALDSNKVDVDANSFKNSLQLNNIEDLPSAVSFLRFSRLVLANTIKEYLRRRTTYGDNITVTNQKLDKAILSTMSLKEFEKDREG